MRTPETTPLSRPGTTSACTSLDRVPLGLCKDLWHQTPCFTEQDVSDILEFEIHRLRGSKGGSNKGI